MALTEEHRSSIYGSLVPILGEEEAEARLAHFPTNDGEELVTKTYLHAEMAELRVDLATMRTEVHQLANRTIVWLAGTMVAVGGLIVAGVGVFG